MFAWLSYSVMTDEWVCVNVTKRAIVEIMSSILIVMVKVSVSVFDWTFVRVHAVRMCVCVCEQACVRLGLSVSSLVGLARQGL